MPAMEWPEGDDASVRRLQYRYVEALLSRLAEVADPAERDALCARVERLLGFTTDGPSLATFLLDPLLALVENLVHDALADPAYDFGGRFTDIRLPAATPPPTRDEAIAMIKGELLPVIQEVADKAAHDHLGAHEDEMHADDEPADDGPEEALDVGAERALRVAHERYEARTAPAEGVATFVPGKPCLGRFKQHEWRDDRCMRAGCGATRERPGSGGASADGGRRGAPADGRMPIICLGEFKQHLWDGGFECKRPGCGARRAGAPSTVGSPAKREAARSAGRAFSGILPSGGVPAARAGAPRPPPGVAELCPQPGCRGTLQMQGDGSQRCDECGKPPVLVRLSGE